MGDAAAEAINQRLDDIAEQLAMLQASLQLHAMPTKARSPWLPLAAAAEALHYKSTAALLNAIDRGRIPLKFVKDTNGVGDKRRKLLVNVEGYASHLRNQ
jgi:hypothetical protein